MPWMMASLRGRGAPTKMFTVANASPSDVNATSTGLSIPPTQTISMSLPSGRHAE